MLDARSGAIDNGAMAVNVPRLPFSLDPLIAEAKRRTRRRRVMLVAAVIVVAVGGAAGWLLASGLSYVPSRPLDAALVPSDGACGDAYGSSSGVCDVRYVPRKIFAVSVVVTNKAAAPITLETARAVVAHPSMLHQIGAGLTVFKRIPLDRCAFSSCPAINPGNPPPYGSVALNPPPYGSERPVPLSLAPGHQALAQLNFRFASCWNHPIPWRPVVPRVTVVYRTMDGLAIHERLRRLAAAVQLTGSSACRR